MQYDHFDSELDTETAIPSSPCAGPSSTSTFATSPLGASSTTPSERDSPARLSSRDKRLPPLLRSTPSHDINDTSSLPNSQDDELDLFSAKNHQPEDIVLLSNHQELPFLHSTPPFVGSSSPSGRTSRRISVGLSGTSKDDDLTLFSREDSTPSGKAKTLLISSETPSPLDLLLQRVASTSNTSSLAEPPPDANPVALLQPLRNVSIQARSSPPSDTIPDHLLTEEQTARRYSLRQRDARQLNPYSIEKQIYKQQMRHNPDAMVKVVSPRRLHSEHGHRERREWDEDFIAPNDESQNQGSPRRHRARVSEEREEAPKPTWLRKAFEMSDDEEQDPPQHASPSVPSKTRMNVHKFPMRLPKPVHDEKVEQSVISYKRRKVSLPYVSLEVKLLKSPTSGVSKGWRENGTRQPSFAIISAFFCSSFCQH